MLAASEWSLREVGAGAWIGGILWPLVVATFMRVGYWRRRRRGGEVSDADTRELKELHEMSFMALLMGGLILPPLAWIVYGSVYNLTN